MQAKMFLLSVALGCLAPAAFATPVLDNVAAGTAEVHSTASHVQINQQTPQVILNWHSFNIGAAESVHFQQPTHGIALNRVNPAQGASEIAGRLSATGKLIIVNPAGIHFHGTAQVDVAGLLATTGNISDKNFLTGNYHFEDNSGLGGSVTNAGKIKAAEHGFVAFMAPHVENTGHITAHVDQIALYSATKFTLKFGHNGLVHFAVDDHLIKEGVRENKFIMNNGHVLAPSSTAKSVLDNAIHVPEKDVARSVYVEDGKIIFSAQIETPQKVVMRTTSTSSSSTPTKEKERPQSAMSNHSDSDFEIITNPERPPRLDLTRSQPQDADWETVSSPHQGINAAHQLGANWEVIDSPRLSEAFPDDEAGLSPLNLTPRSLHDAGSLTPRPIDADWLTINSPRSVQESDTAKITTGQPINSPHLSRASSDDLSPRSPHEADDAHWMAVDPLSSSITYAEQDVPHPLSKSDLLSTKLLSMSINEMADYIVQNPDFLTDSMTMQRVDSPPSPALSINTQFDLLQTQNPTPLLSPVSASHSDSDYIEVSAANLSDGYDSDFDEFITPPQNKLYRISMLKSIYDAINNSTETQRVAASPRIYNHSDSLSSAHLSSFLLMNDAPAINVKSTAIIPQQLAPQNGAIRTAVVSAAKSMAVPLVTAYEIAKYKFDASYLFYKREKNRICPEAFLSDCKIHMPEIIIIR
jgi:filamentous hemagglutinin family protein